MNAPIATGVATRYIGAMSKMSSGKTGRNASTGQLVVTSKSGRTYEVKGAGSMRDTSLKIRGDVDLTKPIAKQALRNPAAKRA